MNKVGENFSKKMLGALLMAGMCLYGGNIAQASELSDKVGIDLEQYELVETKIIEPQSAKMYTSDGNEIVAQEVMQELYKNKTTKFNDVGEPVEQYSLVTRASYPTPDYGDDADQDGSYTARAYARLNYEKVNLISKRMTSVQGDWEIMDNKFVLNDRYYSYSGANPQNTEEDVPVYGSSFYKGISEVPNSLQTMTLDTKANVSRADGTGTFDLVIHIRV